MASHGLSRIAFSNSHEARAMQPVGSVATTGAIRGRPSSTDSSPKNSPGPRVATSSPSRMTRTAPSTTRKNPVPISPCRAITRSVGNSTSTALPATAARSAGWTPENSRHAPSNSLRRPWVSVNRTSRTIPRCCRSLRQPSTGSRLMAECRNGGRRTRRGANSRMASPEEIVDQIAGFALFADLTTPQLERVAHTFDEQWYAEGERVLRGRLPGSALHIILDGDAAVVIDGDQRASLSRGDFFGEVSILLGEPPVADVVAVHQLRCLVLAGPRSGRSCSTTRRSCTGCCRRRRADCGMPTGGGAERPPVPAGHLPGRRDREWAGRVAGFLQPRAARRRACRAVGRRRTGRSVPALAVLPAAPVVDEAVRPGSGADPAYERYDWNSLLADEPEHRAIMPPLMDATSYFPSRRQWKRTSRRSRRRQASGSATAAAGRERDGRRRRTA